MYTKLYDYNNKLLSFCYTYFLFFKWKVHYKNNYNHNQAIKYFLKSKEVKKSIYLLLWINWFFLFLYFLKFVLYVCIDMPICIRKARGGHQESSSILAGWLLVDLTQFRQVRAFRETASIRMICRQERLYNTFSISLSLSSSLRLALNCWWSPASESPMPRFLVCTTTLSAVQASFPLSPCPVVSVTLLLLCVQPQFHCGALILPEAFQWPSHPRPDPSVLLDFG